LKKDSKAAEEDSFGLVGVMSTGAILGVLILNMFVKTDTVVGELAMHHIDNTSLIRPFLAEIPAVAFESFIALLPMVLMLILFQKIKFRVPKKPFRRMLLGFLYTWIGLIIFLVGVNAGFMNVGNIVGHALASYDNKAILVALGFLLGMSVILTEPAVYILTQQIENVTSGYIKKKDRADFLVDRRGVRCGPGNAAYRRARHPALALFVARFFDLPGAHVFCAQDFCGHRL
jgi:hypothetical protein